MYFADIPTDSRNVADYDVRDLISVNAFPQDSGSAYDELPELAYDQDTEAQDKWLTDQLRQGTLTDPRGRHRIITGTYEAAGTSATGHEYSHFDEDFCHDGYSKMIRYNPPENGPEIEEYKKMHAMNAVDAITEYVVPKWRIIHPSRAEKTDRLAATAAAEMAAQADGIVTHHIEVDKFRVIMDEQEVYRQQMGMSGSLGTMVSPSVSFYETNASEGGPGDKLTQMKCHLVPAEAITYPELAADLLSRPSSYLKSFYANNPSAGLTLRQTLEEIADATSEDDLTEGERQMMTSLIRKHLSEMDVNRILDPRMIQFVQQGDPRYIESSAIRDNYERIRSIVCGEIDDESKEAFSSIMIPLAIHMRDRNIPINVENVIGEGEVLLQARDIVSSIVGTNKEQIKRGGVQSFFDFATEEELEILNRTGTKVMALLMPGNNGVTTFLPIYGEEDEDIDRIARTMYGPRRPSGTSARAGFSSGGYYQAGSRLIHGMDQRVAPFEQSPQQQSQKLTYSPYTEGHEFLRRTRLRKFVPPVY
jgi:hypothetical protein